MTAVESKAISSTQACPEIDPVSHRGSALLLLFQRWPPASCQSEGPVSEFTPSCWRARWSMERLARGGIRALRARQEDGGGDSVEMDTGIHSRTGGSDSRDWPGVRSLSHGVSLPTPLVARAQPTSPPAPLQGRCVPLPSTPLPIPWRRDGLVTALSSHEGATVLFVNKAVVLL